jgi:hypothetical protein
VGRELGELAGIDCHARCGLGGLREDAHDADDPAEEVAESPLAAETRNLEAS